MISLTQWAIRHSVSAQALYELECLFLSDYPQSAVVAGDSESANLSKVRLEASRKNCRLWRNNVGVLQDATGRPVRYGLANDSKRLNEKLKSSDAIGWRRVTIEPHHVGNVIAQFLAREVKESGWVYSGTAREIAQMNWVRLVIADGGDAAFCTGEGSL